MAARNAYFPTAANLALPGAADDVIALATTDDTRARDRSRRAAPRGLRRRPGRWPPHRRRGSLATWFGWLEPITAEVVLVASSPAEASSAQRELRRIGVDAIVGACIAPDLASEPAVARVPAITILRRSSFRDLATELGLGEDIVILDVREADERRALRIAGSVAAVHELPPQTEAPGAQCGCRGRLPGDDRG